MPIRINLKELFGSDPQGVTVDKINFNFNKLLELGVGLPGPKGLTGPQGAAGPQGPVGPQGIRGTYWFIGSGDPNFQTFTGLLDGDFYLDTVNSDIWQYDADTDSWTALIDFGAVINNYLLNFGTTFVRGLGPTSPDDDRFILFPFRGNDATAQASDILGGSSQNDILFLNNFNEKLNVISIDNFPANTNDLYTAIQKIFTDATGGVATGRYHLELGSLNQISGQNELSSLNHNLKIRYLKEEVTSTDYPNSNEIINRARFSLTVPETVADVNISEQGVFEFIAPKYNADASAIKKSSTVRMGATEALSETALTGAIPVDGIDISSDLKSINLGTVRELEGFDLTLTTDLEGDWGMMSISDSLKGLAIKGDTYHIKGSLNTIHSDSVQSNSDLVGSLTSGTASQGHQGIFSDGQYLMVVSPENAAAREDYDVDGHLRIWDISDPDNPVSVSSLSNSSEFSLSGVTGTLDIHGNPHGDGPITGYTTNTPSYRFNGIPLTGVRDIAFAGKYGVIVRYKPNVPGVPSGEFILDSFVVFELDSDLAEVKTVSWLGDSDNFSQFMTGSTWSGTGISELIYAKRVKISGNWALVMTSPPNFSSTSRLLAIDITNPARPFTTDDYICAEVASSKFIDFDIHGETAHVLSQRNDAGTYRLSIYKVNLYQPDQQDLSYNTWTNLESYGGSAPASANGSIKAVGKRVFAVSTIDRTFYIYSDAEKRPDEAMDLVSDTVLPANYSPYDIEISGRYAYIYAQNTSLNRSTILTYDISDDSSPLLLEPYETFASAAGNGRPSKMTMVGDRIYTVATGNGTDSPGVRSVKIDGINSPAAKIGNIHAKDIKVANNLSISQALQVGRSATIGSGGLWVDKGEGIRTDSRINVNLSSLVPYTQFLTNSGGLSVTARGITETDSDPYVTPELAGTSVKFRNSVVQTSGGGGRVRGHLVDIYDLDTPDLKAIEIQLDQITSASDVYGLYLDLGTVTGGDKVGIHIEGADRNFIEGRFDTPDVQTDGAIQIPSVEEEDTISSGVFTGVGGNWAAGSYLAWQRIGDIVHVKGYLHDATGVTSDTFLPHTKGITNSPFLLLPIVPECGTAREITGGGGLDEVYIISPLDRFRIGPSPGTIPLGSTWYVDFTYRVLN